MPAGGIVVAGGAAVLGPLLGGIIGAQQSQADRDAANAAAQQAYAQIQQMGAPPDQWQNIILQQFKQVGLYTPALESQVQAGVSQAAQVMANPNLVNAQMGALNQMQQMANTGNTAQTQAQLNQTEQQVGAATQGQLGAIAQQAAQRGEAGGGSQLAQQLAAIQGGANTLSNQGLQAAANNQSTAANAISNAANQAGQMNSQQYAQAQARAQAADQRNMYNTQMQQQVQNSNANSLNQAQQQNLANAQNVSNMNVGAANQLMGQQANAATQQWQNQLQLQQAKAGALLGQSGQYNTQAGQQAGLYQGIGTGIGTGAGAYMNYLGQTAKNNPSNTTTSGSTSYSPSSTSSSSSPYTYNTPDFSNSYANSDNMYDGGMVADHKQSALDKLGQMYYSGGEVQKPGASEIFNKFDMANQNKPTFHNADENQNAELRAELENQMHHINAYKKGMADSLKIKNENSPPQKLSQGGMAIPNNNFAMGGPVQMPQAQQQMGLSDKLAMLGMQQLPQTMSIGGMPAKGVVPGKAKVKGDSPKNDTVDAKLSPGEIVVPREVVDKGSDAGFGFLHAIINKHKVQK